jgi:hypothetical protein
MNAVSAAAIPAGSSRPEYKVDAVYFETRTIEPVVEHLIFALEGVCSALDAEQLSFEDEDQLNRIANLSCAARILARQLHDRMTSKPPTRRQLDATRKAAANWSPIRKGSNDGPAASD